MDGGIKGSGCGSGAVAPVPPVRSDGAVRVGRSGTIYGKGDACGAAVGATGVGGWCLVVVDGEVAGRGGGRVIEPVSSAGGDGVGTVGEGGGVEGSFVTLSEGVVGGRLPGTAIDPDVDVEGPGGCFGVGGLHPDGDGPRHGLPGGRRGDRHDG